MKLIQDLGSNFGRAPAPFARRLKQKLNLFAIFTLFSIPASGKDLRVLVLNAKTGRSFPKIMISMSVWNGDFNIYSKEPLPSVKVTLAAADSTGWAVFQLPEPLPQHIGFSVGNIGDFMGCWRLSNDSPETALATGLLAKYNEVRCGKSKATEKAEPGEVVLIDRKLTLWEKVRQELP